MTVVLVGNTKSGRGLARKLFERFDAALKRRGVYATKLTLNDPEFSPEQHWDAARFRGARAILPIGGDGTVNAVADAAIRTRTPVYHVPAGNENLVARRYGMTRNPDTFLRALAEHRVIHADVGRAGPDLASRRFLIMATVGPDASVIERLHHTRTKALGHLAYVEPVLREAISPYLPAMSVTVDGKRFVHDRPGWLIVGNDREYASRLNFVSHAGPETRSLALVFLPATSLRDCVAWTFRAWARRHTRDPRIVVAHGTRIRIEGTPDRTHPLSFQLDGEHDPAISESARPNGTGRSTIDINLDEARLPILVPDPKKL